MGGGLQLTLATGWYDRTSALFDGSVRPDGIDLRCVAMGPGELFARMARSRDFPVAEMSFSTYVNLRGRGDDRLVAIPVFPSRVFRHGYIFVNTGSGIDSPADLRGKRVGTMQYQLSSNLWVRGILDDDYDVAPSAFSWHIGGQDAPGGGERAVVSIPDNVDVTPIGADQTLSDLLATGTHYWSYGVPANRAELDTMLGWAHRHGITSAKLAVDDVFAAETLDLTCDG